MEIQIKQELDNFELEILERIQNGEIKGIKDSAHPMADPTVAIITWVENGRIETGRCRWANRNNIITKEGRYDSWSVSPFPGAWIMITLSQIMRVRHVEAF